MLLKLLFPRWKKRHATLHSYIWMGVAVVAFVIPMLVTALDITEKGTVAIIIYFSLNLVVSTVVNRVFGDTVVGGIRFEYGELDWQVRLALKEKAIFYMRKMEKETYVFEFPGHSLTMTLQSHRPNTRNRPKQAVSWLEFYKVTSNNSGFVDELTGVVDEISLMDIDSAEKQPSPQ